MFTLFYLQVANAMNIPEVYPNAHRTNPYYRYSVAPTVDGFICQMLASYRALNARWWLPENIGIGSVADRIANEEAEYEKQLVRLSPPVIPSQGPPLGFRIDEPTLK